MNDVWSSWSEHKLSSYKMHGKHNSTVLLMYEARIEQLEWKQILDQTSAVTLGTPRVNYAATPRSYRILYFNPRTCTIVLGTCIGKLRQNDHTLFCLKLHTSLKPAYWATWRVLIEHSDCKGLLVNQEWVMFLQSSLPLFVVHFNCKLNHIIHKMCNAKLHSKVDGIDCRTIRASVLWVMYHYVKDCMFLYRKLVFRVGFSSMI